MRLLRRARTSPSFPTLTLGAQATRAVALEYQRPPVPLDAQATHVLAREEAGANSRYFDRELATKSAIPLSPSRPSCDDILRARTATNFFRTESDVSKAATCVAFLRHLIGVFGAERFFTSLYTRRQLFHLCSTRCSPLDGVGLFYEKRARFTSSKKTLV